MQQDDPQFKLRLPPDLKKQLEIAAEVNHRTLGAEVVARLQQSVLPMETVVSFKWGAEGHIVNLRLPDSYVDEVVRPAAVNALRVGLDKWLDESPEEVLTFAAKHPDWAAENPEKVFKAEAAAKPPVLVKRRA